MFRLGIKLNKRRFQQFNKEDIEKILGIKRHDRLRLKKI